MMHTIHKNQNFLTHIQVSLPAAALPLRRGSFPTFISYFHILLERLTSVAARANPSVCGMKRGMTEVLLLFQEIAIKYYLGLGQVSQTFYRYSFRFGGELSTMTAVVTRCRTSSAN